MYELKSTNGIYREGSVLLQEIPSGVVDGTAAIVTFLTRELTADKWQDAGQIEILPAPPNFAKGWHSPELEFYQHHEPISSTWLI